MRAIRSREYLVKRNVCFVQQQSLNWVVRASVRVGKQLILEYRTIRFFHCCCCFMLFPSKGWFGSVRMALYQPARELCPFSHVWIRLNVTVEAFCQVFCFCCSVAGPDDRRNAFIFVFVHCEMSRITHIALLTSKSRRIPLLVARIS